VEQFRDTLKATIEKSYSGKSGNVTWHTSVDIKVIDDVNQIQQGEHVFRLVDNTYTRSRGLSAHGHLWMEISASTSWRPAREGRIGKGLSESRIDWSA